MGAHIANNKKIVIIFLFIYVCDVNFYQSEPFPTSHQIYSTNFFRTQETARFIAIDKGISIDEYKTNNTYNKSFKEENKGKTILVVGHSNTIPFLANKIIGEDIYSSIDESIHGNLYILNIVNENVTYQLLNLE